MDIPSLPLNSLESHGVCCLPQESVWPLYEFSLLLPPCCISGCWRYSQLVEEDVDASHGIIQFLLLLATWPCSLTLLLFPWSLIAGPFIIRLHVTFSKEAPLTVSATCWSFPNTAFVLCIHTVPSQYHPIFVYLQHTHTHTSCEYFWCLEVCLLFLIEVQLKCESQVKAMVFSILCVFCSNL